jgi:hypothetical protein
MFGLWRVSRNVPFGFAHSLLTNAIKFTLRGYVGISVRVLLVSDLLSLLAPIIFA